MTRGGMIKMKMNEVQCLTEILARLRAWQGNPVYGFEPKPVVSVKSRLAARLNDIGGQP